MILTNKLQERRDDERHRGAYLVRDIDEETQFLLIEFLLMDMILQTKALIIAHTQQSQIP